MLHILTDMVCVGHCLNFHLKADYRYMFTAESAGEKKENLPACREVMGKSRVSGFLTRYVVSSLLKYFTCGLRPIRGIFHLWSSV